MLALATSQTNVCTVEEFEHFLRSPENQDRLFELIEGEIVEKMPTLEHGYLAGLFVTKLNLFALPKRLGFAAVEARYGLPTDRRNSRLPDVSFLLAGQPLVKEGAVPRMPDLAIEIQSPDDTIKVMREKAAYYLANGTRLVWLVFPRRRYIEVYQPDAEMEVRFGSDLLDGGDLLPGFSLAVAEIFADPLAGEARES
jgi:Uma2 family endonuclease